MGGDHMEGKGKRSKYLPAECTALELLEYMVLRKEEGPFTLYRLMNHGVRSHQRRDRMRQMLELMVERGWVEVLPQRRYRATPKGEEVCEQTEEFREFYRSLRLGSRHPDRGRTFFSGVNSLPPRLNTGDGAPPIKKEVRKDEVGDKEIGGLR